MNHLEILAILERIIFRGSEVIGQLPDDQFHVQMWPVLVISGQMKQIKGLELIPSVDFAFGSCS